MCNIVTLDSGQAPLDWNPIWVEMKEKGLESIDAENLWKIRANLKLASFHLSLFYFVPQENLARTQAGKWQIDIPLHRCRCQLKQKCQGTDSIKLVPEKHIASIL